MVLKRIRENSLQALNRMSGIAKSHTTLIKCALQDVAANSAISGFIFYGVSHQLFHPSHAFFSRRKNKRELFIYQSRKDFSVS